MASLKPFKKDFYQPHQITQDRPNYEVDRYREKHEITIVGKAPNPIQSKNNLIKVNLIIYIYNIYIKHDL